MSLTLAYAQAMIEAAFAKAAALKCKPLAIVVVDAGGHVIAAQRQDGAAFLRVDVSTAKASGALGLGLSSRTLAEIASLSPAAIAAVTAIAPRGLIPSPGGIVILNSADEPIGAIAASGDTGDNDEACALAGIEATPFKAQPPLKLG